MAHLKKLRLFSYSVLCVGVHVYANCGSLEEARDIFHSLRVHDVVTWTTLIVAYIEHGHGEEALKCFAETWG